MEGSLGSQDSGKYTYSRHCQVASLSSKEKENILQAVDGKSGSFPKERSLDSFAIPEARSPWK